MRTTKLNKSKNLVKAKVKDKKKKRKLKCFTCAKKISNIAVAEKNIWTDWANWLDWLLPKFFWFYGMSSLSLTSHKSLYKSSDHDSRSQAMSSSAWCRYTVITACNCQSWFGQCVEAKSDCFWGTTKSQTVLNIEGSLCHVWNIEYLQAGIKAVEKSAYVTAYNEC